MFPCPFLPSLPKHLSRRYRVGNEELEIPLITPTSTPFLFLLTFYKINIFPIDSTKSFFCFSTVWVVGRDFLDKFGRSV